MVYTCLFFGFIFGSYQNYINYINVFKNSSKLYSFFVDGSIYGTTMLTWRELVYYYFDNVYYVRQTGTRDGHLHEYFDDLEELNSFTSTFLEKDYSFLDYPEFEDMLQAVSSGDICNDILHLEGKHKQYCETTFGAVLRRGIVQTYQKFLIDMRNDYEQTNFYMAKRAPPKPTAEHMYLVFFIQRVND